MGGRGRRGRMSGHASHRILKPFLIVALLLGLWAWISGDDAHAETPAPKFSCGQAFTFSTLTLGNNVRAGEAAKWAYAQVAPVAHTRVTETEYWGDATFYWASSGDTTAAGDAYGNAGLSTRQVWFHTRQGGDADLTSRYGARQALLRDVLHDLGVPNATSTGSGLSSHDQTALTAVCTAQAKAKAAAAAAKASPAAKAKTATAGKDKSSAPKASSSRTVPAPMHTAGLAVGGLLSLMLAVYYVRPGLLSRKPTEPTL